MTPVLKHRLDLAFNNFFIKRGVQRSLDQICYCLMLLSLKSLDKSAGCFDSTLYFFIFMYIEKMKVGLIANLTFWPLMRLRN